MSDPIEPKPLSKDRREQNEHWASFDGVLDYEDEIWVRELLAAERFWREAVKNVYPFVDHREHGGSWKECIFCHAGWGPRAHERSCLWELAQL